MEKALEISKPIYRVSGQPLTNSDIAHIRGLMRTFIYIKLTLDVTTILVLLFVFQAYTTKLQIVSDAISKLPQYDLGQMKEQMDFIATSIKDHKEWELKTRSQANMLSKQLQEIKSNISSKDK